MTSGQPADPRQTDPYATVYGPSGRAAGHKLPADQQELSPDLPASNQPDEGRRPPRARGSAAMLAPAEWRAKVDALMAAGRLAEAVRLVHAGLEDADRRLSLTRAVREEIAAARTVIEQDRIALEAERERFNDERRVIARQRTKLAQDRKAHEAEVREVTRLRDEVTRREIVVRDSLAALARKGRRTVSEPLPVIDDHGAALRPDPSTAATPAEFMAALRQYREWSGNPSYRVISARIGGRPVASTIQAMLARDELPTRLIAVDAVIRGCGGSREDREKFATAWRLLRQP